MYLENNSPNRIPMNPILAWIFVALWMLLIFLFSAQNGTDSGSVSRTIAEATLRLFNQAASESAIAGLESVIRNLAHGSVFFILAILTSNAMTRTGITDIRNAIVTLAGCALYAVTDEWHQSFVPGRAMQIEDLGIDLLGIILAVLIYQGIVILRYYKSKREKEEAF